MELEDGRGSLSAVKGGASYDWWNYMISLLPDGCGAQFMLMSLGKVIASGNTAQRQSR